MADTLDIEIGDGIFRRDTGSQEEGVIAKPTSKSRKWLTKTGLQDAGGQFKDGEKVPAMDVDIEQR